MMMRMSSASVVLRSVSRRRVVASSAQAARYLSPAAGSSALLRLDAAGTTPSPPPNHGRRQLSTSTNTSSLSKEERIAAVLDEHNLLKFDTLHEMQVNATLVFAKNELFGTYRAASASSASADEGKEEKKEGEEEEEGGGTFEWMTYEEYGEKVDRCRTVLKDLGVEEYSKVGIISNNRWEWATIAAASYSLNASLVPMYEAQLPSDWTYILNDSGCNVLFCATQDIYDRAKIEVLPSTPSVKHALLLDGTVGDPHAFATSMANATKVDDASSSSIIIKPTPDDLANLVYTSGTTGKPKGVELTHLNFTSNVKGVRTMSSDPHDFIRSADKSLAFLPWAHSYGQTCELWCAIAHGSGMGICRGVPHILEDLQMVKPKVLFAVPTLYKRVYDGVQNAMESASPLRKGLMKKAFQLGRKNVEANRGTGPSLSLIEKVQFKALDSIVLSKIRNRFGGQLRHGFVAGAATPTEILDFMDDIGIPICEGYGLTETSPIITLNSPERRKVGSVGSALGGVNVLIVDPETKQEVKELGEEGEVCCMGPNVMRGYWGKPEETDKVITLAPDGKSRLFHTGDLGKMDTDGYVSITGRLKEQYKLENGKYVVPTPIEESIGMSRFISQVVLAGANRPYNVALLVPDWSSIRTELNVCDSISEEDLVNDSHVKRLIDGEIESHCAGLKKFEVPNAWAFVAPFTASNNMLTPKMSIRRHMVIKYYEDVIHHLYNDDEMVTEAADGHAHPHEEEEQSTKVA